MATVFKRLPVGGAAAISKVEKLYRPGASAVAAASADGTRLLATGAHTHTVEVHSESTDFGTKSGRENGKAEI